MYRIRILGSTILAMCLAIGLSSSALGTDLVVGHGIPGVSVDVCAATGGKLIELKSDFQYGKTFKLKNLPAGRYYITVRAAKGECEGRKLIKLGPLSFDGREDLSVIATKTGGRPTVEIFDHSEAYFDDRFIAGDASPAAPALAPAVISIKHAAMLGKADVYLSILLNDRVMGPAAAEPTLSGGTKGSVFNEWFFPADVRVAVARTGKSRILAETPLWELREGMINHIVAVGPPDQLRFLRYRTENKGVLVGDR